LSSPNRNIPIFGVHFRFSLGFGVVSDSSLGLAFRFWDMKSFFQRNLCSPHLAHLIFGSLATVRHGMYKYASVTLSVLKNKISTLCLHQTELDL
jgi:hypothetical protein